MMFPKSLLHKNETAWSQFIYVCVLVVFKKNILQHYKKLCLSIIKNTSGMIRFDTNDLLFPLLSIMYYGHNVDD